MAMEFSHRFISSTITVALVLIVFAIVDYTYTARDESTSTWDSFDQVQVPINKQLGFEDDELFLFVQVTKV